MAACLNLWICKSSANKFLRRFIPYLGTHNNRNFNIICKTPFYNSEFLNKATESVRSLIFHREKVTNNPYDFISPDEFETKSVPQQETESRIEDLDFFGIENDTGIVNIKQLSSTDDIVKKFEKLRLERRTEISESIITTNFGYMRLDTLNQPRYHGQYDQKIIKNVDSKESTSSVALNESLYEDEDYSQNHQIKATDNVDPTVENDLSFIDETYFSKIKSTTSSGSDKAPNIFEEQYFSEMYPASDNTPPHEDYTEKYLHSAQEMPVIKDIFYETSQFPSSESKFKEQYSKNQFMENKSEKKLKVSCNNLDNSNTFNSSLQLANNDRNTSLSNLKVSSKRTEQFNIMSNNDLLNANSGVINSMDKGISQAGQENISKQMDIVIDSVKPSRKVIADTQNPITAYDMAVKIRNEKLTEKTSSAQINNEDEDSANKQRWKILKNQVINFKWLTKGEIVDILKKSVVLNNFDIIAIDKPYGLPVLYGPKVQYCLVDLLPDLAKALSKPSDPISELFLVHRIDKCASGLLLLAKTKEMAFKLSHLFKERRITKTYWAITKGIPNPREGLIDIPITEGSINGARRMVLQPERTAETKEVVPKTKRHSYKALTYYKVIDTNGSSSLIELCPETGVKHQLRVHLAFGLNCPILGDHKYSHYTKLAPQRLPQNLLDKLGIPQSKVRYLPMLLHSKILVIPEIVEGRNVFITRFLPKHFQENMKRLKLKPE